MLDIVRQVLGPPTSAPSAAAELTVGMLQLVASGRVATPLWAVQDYLDKGYVTARPIGKTGLTGRLYAASAPATSVRPYLADFVGVMRESCFVSLKGIALL